MPVKTPVVIGIALASAIGLAAVATYVHNNPHAVIPPGFSSQTQPLKSKTESNKRDKGEILVFVPQMGKDGISFTTQSVPYPDGTDKLTYSVNQFLKVANITSPNVQCLGVDLHEGLATIGLSPDFKASYGAFDEKILIDGFAATLGQYKRIKFYNIEVNGKPLTTLGSVDLSQPVPVIRPNLSLSKPSWDPGKINERANADEQNSSEKQP